MKKKITYKDAGVDTELADDVIRSLRPRLMATFRPEVIGGMGGFSALFRPNWKNFRSPLLVSATDGVGTKLKIAFMTGIHDSVGIDLVAMNVNDILVSGAEPLFFLDYFATGRIDPGTVRSVISGIAEGCEQAGCSLIGGETAEMPDFYAEGEYDLAGFCVGIVEESRLIDGSSIERGDLILGIESNGLHSNGFSLVRKVFLNDKQYSLDKVVPELGKTLAEELLRPTRIYVRPILKLLGKIKVKAMAHITGGGFLDNMPRVVPEQFQTVIHRGAWNIPAIFNILRNEANLRDEEMFKTFNMGVGFVIIMASPYVEEAIRMLKADGLQASVIGEIAPREMGSDKVCIS